MPGPFNLDHLQSLKPLLFPNFYTFFTFILGGQFLLPQRANIGKRAISQLQNWMRQRVSSAWGSQTRPFAALLFQCFSNFFTFILGGQFLLPQRVPIMMTIHSLEWHPPRGTGVRLQVVEVGVPEGRLEVGPRPVEPRPGPLEGVPHHVEVQRAREPERLKVAARFTGIG